MIIDTPREGDYGALRRLMRDTFCESESFLDLFYSIAYKKERTRVAFIEDEPVAALYWFDCEYSGLRAAYLYAIATDERHRGKGIASELIRNTAEQLRALGYDSVILVPAGSSLFGFYERLGFTRATTINEFSAASSEEGMPLREISSHDYMRARRDYLPDGGVIEDESVFSLLDDAKFYTGEGVILATRYSDSYSRCIEILGDTSCAPAILATLGCKVGLFRTHGHGRDFAMYMPLSENATAPTYFGVALDI